MSTVDTKKYSIPPTRFYQAEGVEGKIVIVTGATAGIGERIAYRFAELGCKKVILTGRREERLVKLKAELTEIAKDTGNKYPDPIEYVSCFLLLKLLKQSTHIIFKYLQHEQNP